MTLAWGHHRGDIPQLATRGSVLTNALRELNVDPIADAFRSPHRLFRKAD